MESQENRKEGGGVTGWKKEPSRRERRKAISRIGALPYPVPTTGDVTHSLENSILGNVQVRPVG